MCPHTTTLRRLALHTSTQETAEQIAARWRSGADADSPAGPLYASGRFAEVDIAAPGRAGTTFLTCDIGSACTAANGACC